MIVSSLRKKQTFTPDMLTRYIGQTVDIDIRETPNTDRTTIVGYVISVQGRGRPVGNLNIVECIPSVGPYPLSISTQLISGIRIHRDPRDTAKRKRQGKRRG